MPKMNKLTPVQNAGSGRRVTTPTNREVRTRLADVLFTSTQQRVLALLFSQPFHSFFASELIQLTGSGSGAVQRELQRLGDSGLVTVTRIGKQKHHKANPTSPVFKELRNLVIKTVAMVDPLRHALEPMAEKITLALNLRFRRQGQRYRRQRCRSAGRRGPPDLGKPLCCARPSRTCTGA